MRWPTTRCLQRKSRLHNRRVVIWQEDISPRLQSIMLDGEQVEPTSENPTVGAEPKSSSKRLGADVRIAHQGPMPDETASSKRPDTRRQSYLDAIEQSACKRGGVHTRLLLARCRRCPLMMTVWAALRIVVRTEWRRKRGSHSALPCAPPFGQRSCANQLSC